MGLNSELYLIIRKLVVMCFKMFLKILFLVSVSFSYTTHVAEAFQSVNDDTYWRDLHVDIPIDALPGGSTSSNTTTYIGQVVHSSTLWFGDVNNDGFIHYNLYNELISEHKNIKILCTKNPERFQWKPIHDELDFRQIDKNRLISEVCDVGKCFVGRAHYHNSVVVGTVYFKRGSEFLFNGATDFNNFETKTFQLLYYNPGPILEINVNVTITMPKRDRVNRERTRVSQAVAQKCKKINKFFGGSAAKKAKYNTTSKDQDSEDVTNTSTQINSGAIESGNENLNNFSENSKSDEQDEHEILNTSFQAQASNSSLVSNNNEHISQEFSQNDKNNFLHDEHISNDSVTYAPDFGLAKQPQLVVADGESAIKIEPIITFKPT
ncbi:hypothetical protein RN001_014328 [Aquatica leii]|uniref:Uncharacterized protein n=1 Tax=Aquatica leii TaxID=1421715 RepID=A0AAN7QDU0_9COLE|nr:hypothetical protein RN001_014328 [Aquatica leii]